MTAIHPREALGIPGLVLVDLRPSSERYGGVGFIPGSLHVPGQPDAEHWVAMVREAAGSGTPVLVCLSGTRARSLAERHGWSYLEGGVLAWGAEGLPLAGRPPARPSTDPKIPVEAFPRHMASCFVGELAEAALDQPDLDPLALLHHCFERAGASFTDPTIEGLLRTLDHAALASLTLGTPIARVAANLDHMLSRLPLVPGWSRVA